MSSADGKYDEKQGISVTDPERTPSPEGQTEEYHQDEYKGILGRLRYYEAYLDKKLGVEAHAPRRILPHEKKPPNPWIMFFMWGSTGSYALEGLTLGFIGWEYGMAVSQTIPIMMCGSLVGSAAAVSFIFAVNWSAH